MSVPVVDARARQRANLRLGWILASVAVMFALGFAAKVWLFAH
jgi:hypothetical protein